MFSTNQLIGAMLIGLGAGLILSVVIGGWFLRLILGGGLIAIGFLFGRCKPV